MTEMNSPSTSDPPTRAVLLGQIPSNALEAQFTHSIAVIIGINTYVHERILHTARPDAERLAQLLQNERRDVHDRYEVFTCYDDEATADALEHLIFHQLVDRVKETGPRTRLLFYFAGHGDAQDDGSGVKGFLFPHDANASDGAKLLPMDKVQEAVAGLDCQHILLILDCCSAGALPRSLRGRSRLHPQTVYWDYLKRYVGRKARQVITSAAAHQLAADEDPQYRLGLRDTDEKATHSPFAQALFEALDPDSEERRSIGRIDHGPPVVTASYLYGYISEALYRRLGKDSQTPGLWTINDKGHDQGEFVFLLPGTQVALESAPDLTKPESNPWPGLRRQEPVPRKAIETLAAELPYFDHNVRILAETVANNSLVTVMGGHSEGRISPAVTSLMPCLEAFTSAADQPWYALPPLTLTAQPLLELRDYLDMQLEGVKPATDMDPSTVQTAALLDKVSDLSAQHPDRQLLFQLNLEESLLETDRDTILFPLGLLLADMAESDQLHIVLILPKSDWNVLGWLRSDVPFEIGLPNQIVLRQLIEQPANANGVILEPYPAFVETLIGAVENEAAALPLLSEMLHRVHLHFAEELRQGLRGNSRTLTLYDYEAVGKLTGVVTNLAQSLYNDLPDDLHRSTLLRVLMRLVELEDGRYIPRRALRTEFNYPNDEDAARAAQVINRLIVQGLVVLGENNQGKATVELGHSALLLHWQPLRRQLVGSEAQWELQRELRSQVERWLKAQEEAQENDLWDDNPRLPQLIATLWPGNGNEDGEGGIIRQTWQFLWPDVRAPANTQWLNRTEVDFVRASIDKRTRYWRWVVAITLAVIIGLSVLSGVALWQRGIAVENEEKAQIAATSEAYAKGTAVANEQLAVENKEIAEAAATAEADARIRENRAAQRTQAVLLERVARSKLEEHPLLAIGLTLEGLALLPKDYAEDHDNLMTTIQGVAATGRVHNLGESIEKVYSTNEDGIFLLDTAQRVGELRQMSNSQPLVDLPDQIENVVINNDKNADMALVEYLEAMPELRRLHDGSLLTQFSEPVDGIHFSPSTTIPIFVVDYTDGESELYFTESDSAPIALPGKVSSMFFSPYEDDISSVVISYRDQASELRQTTDGERLATFAGNVRDIHFSPDPESPTFVAEYSDVSAEILRRSDGSLVSSLDDQLTGVKFAPTAGTVPINQQVMMVGYEDQPGELRRISDGEVIVQLSGIISHATSTPLGELSSMVPALGWVDSFLSTFTTPDEVLQVEFSLDPGSEFFVVYYANAPAELRRSTNGELIATLEDGTTRTEFSADSRLLAVYKETITIKDLFFIKLPITTATAKLRRTTDGSLVTDETLEAVYFSPDLASDVFVVDYSESEDTIYRLSDGSPIETFPAEVSNVQFSPNINNTTFAVWFDDSPGELRNGKDGLVITELTGVVDSLDFNPNPETDNLVINYKESPSEIRQSDGEIAKTLEENLSDVDFIKDSAGAYFIAKDESDQKKLYRNADGTLLPLSYEKVLDSVEFGPPGSSLLKIQYKQDEHTEIWLDNTEYATRLVMLERDLEEAIFSADGNWLITLYAGGRAFVLDLTWLQEMNGDPESMDSGSLIQIICTRLKTPNLFKYDAEISSYMGGMDLKGCPVVP